MTLLRRFTSLFKGSRGLFDFCRSRPVHLDPGESTRSNGSSAIRVELVPHELPTAEPDAGLSVGWSPSTACPTILSRISLPGARSTPGSTSPERSEVNCGMRTLAGRGAVLGASRGCFVRSTPEQHSHNPPCSVSGCSGSGSSLAGTPRAACCTCIPCWYR